MGGPGSGRRTNFAHVNLAPGQLTLPRTWGGGNGSWAERFKTEAELAEIEFGLYRTFGYAEGVQAAIGNTRPWQRLTLDEQKQYIKDTEREFDNAAAALEEAKSRPPVNPADVAASIRAGNTRVLAALQAIFQTSWAEACDEEANLRSEIRTLQKEADDERTTTSAQAQELIILRGNLDTAQRENSDKSIQFQTLQDAKSKVDTELTKASADISNLQEQVDDLAALQALHDSEIQTCRDNAELARVESVKEIKRQTDEVSARHNELVEGYTNEISGLQQKCRGDLEDVRNEHSLAVVVLGEISDEEKERLVRKHAGELSALRQEYDQKYAQMQAEHNSVAATLETTAAKLAQKSIDYDTTAANLKFTTAELAQKTREYDSTTAILAYTDEKLARKTKQETRNRTEISNLRQAGIEMAYAHKRLNRHFVATKHAYEDRDIDCASLEVQLADIQESLAIANDDFTLMLADHQEEVAEWQLQLAQSKVADWRKGKRISVLEAAASQLRTEDLKKGVELSTLRQQVSDLRSEISEMQQAGKRTIKKHDAEILEERREGADRASGLVRQHTAEIRKMRGDYEKSKVALQQEVSRKKDDLETLFVNKSMALWLAQNQNERKLRAAQLMTGQLREKLAVYDLEALRQRESELSAQYQSLQNEHNKKELAIRQELGQEAAEYQQKYLRFLVKEGKARQEADISAQELGVLKREFDKVKANAKTQDKQMAKLVNTLRKQKSALLEGDKGVFDEGEAELSALLKSWVTFG